MNYVCVRMPSHIELGRFTNWSNLYKSSKTVGSFSTASIHPSRWQQIQTKSTVFESKFGMWVRLVMRIACFNRTCWTSFPFRFYMYSICYIKRAILPSCPQQRRNGKIRKRFAVRWIVLSHGFCGHINQSTLVPVSRIYSLGARF